MLFRKFIAIFSSSRNLRIKTKTVQSATLANFPNCSEIHARGGLESLWRKKSNYPFCFTEVRKHIKKLESVVSPASGADTDGY